MAHLRVEIHKGDLFPDDSSSLAWAKGTAFISGRRVHDQALIQAFDSLNSHDDVLRRLNGLNGFYAVSFRRGPVVYAAVDRMRSIPLYYSLVPSRLLLSDDPRWIQNRLGSSSPDPVSVSEFLLAGYVTGSNTLDSRICQLQAGELLIAEPGSSGLHIELVRYYEFRHENCSDAPVESLLENLGEVTLSSIRRLAAYANGRQIAIPLSGGLDSRLIAMSLKRLGYDNVMAFSYGRKDNAESRISQSVAEQLGIPWYFVEYTPEKWKQWYESQQYGGYIQFAEGLTSVAHCQDWPAFMEMVSKHVLADGAVIAPGHSADFVAGSHIPVEPRKMVSDNLEAVTLEIWNHHYSLNAPQLAAEYSGLEVSELRNSLQLKIGRLLRGCDAGDLSKAVDAYEYWDWQERQAKFIVNSVRVYDFWGYKWWLPWWDAEFISFWQRVPLKYRLGKCLYDEYVDSVQRRLGVVIGGKSPRDLKPTIRDLLQRVGLWGFARTAYQVYKYSYGWRREVDHHPLAWYGLVEPSRLSLLRRRGSNINTFLAVDQIKRRLTHRSDHP